MIRPGLAGEPEWKRFLRLGEDLLAQPDAAAQVHLFTQTVAGLFGCMASVWLSPPYYPLPGQPDVPLVAAGEIPPLAAQAIETGSVLCEIPSKKNPSEPVDCSGSRVAAFPLLTQDHALGVLLVERKQGRSFHKEELAFLEGLAAHSALALEVSRQAALKMWRSGQLDLVSRVSGQIANVFELEELCQRVTSLIQKTFDFYEVAIYTLQPESELLQYRASSHQGNPDIPVEIFEVRLGQGLIGLAAQIGQEIISYDVARDPRYRFIPTLPDTCAEVCLPIISDQQVVGVLDIQSRKKNSFHEVDLQVLRSLVDNISLAIERARLYGDLRKHADEMSAVYSVSHALISILDLDELLSSVVDVIRAQFGFPYVHLFTVHSGRRKIFYEAGSGARSTGMRTKDFTYDLDDPMGIIPWVARNNQTRLANDVSQDPLYRPNPVPPDDTKSELVIPLAYAGDVLAVLDLQGTRLNAFNPEEVSLLESLGASVAVSIRNATLYRSEAWRRKVGESFRDVASLLSSNVALNSLLETILNELERNLPCDGSAIWLLDEKSGKMRLASTHGASEELMNQAWESSQDIQNWLLSALEGNEPIVRTPSDPIGTLGIALGFSPDYSSIAAPLRIGDSPIGILTLAHGQPGKYGTEARLLTTTFASYAAAAIHNARLFASSQEQAWVSTILLQVAEASQSVTSADELFSTMVRLTRLLVGIKKCGMFFWDETENAFLLKAWYGLDRKPELMIFTEEETPALARLRRERTVIFIQDAAQELNLPAAALPADLGHLALLPLVSRENFLGAFLVAHQPASGRDEGQDFDEQLLSILQGIARQTAVTLENLRLLEARQEEAYVTAVLLQVAQAVVSQNELPDILDTVAHLLPILLGIDACVIFLWDADREVFDTVQAMTGDRELDQELVNLSFAEGEYHLLDSVRSSDEPFLSPLMDQNLPASQWKDLKGRPVSELEQNNAGPDEQILLAYPLSVKGKVLGALLARETGLSPAFQERRLEILHGITQQVALAIQNEQLKIETVGRERLEHEVQLARQIQTTFLPDSLPVCPGWEIAARWQMARLVGGDFYDIFPLSKDRLGLAVADVSDKGLAAALYMTVARTLIRAYSRHAKSSAGVLERVNNPMVNDTPNSMFVTAVYAMLWTETGEILYTNAGHNRPLIVRACSGMVEQLPKGGLAMGVLDNIKLQEHRFRIDPGDVLLLYTDGVTESFSPSGEAFGEVRLMDLLANNCGRSVQNLVSTLEEGLRHFRGGAPPSDDLTLLAIKRTG